MKTRTGKNGQLGVDRKKHSRAVILCNGAYPRKRFWKKYLTEDSFIVCADGGANTAKKMNIIPDVIIGDFDSITRETHRYFERKKAVEMLRRSSQEETDLEKAMKHIRRKKIHQIVIIGATGGLIDHTFGNLSILGRYCDAFDILIIDAQYKMRFITSKIDVHTTPGERISLIPFPSASGITTSGLKYELHHEGLALGKREGTCNEAKASQVMIEIKQGLLLIFYPLNARTV